MYTIIPLLLAHIQELNKQILFLFKFIVKNILLKSNYKDHRNDCVVTTFTLISILFGLDGIYWVDGIVGIGISIWSLTTGIGIFLESYNVLMDISLDEETKETIMKPKGLYWIFTDTSLDISCLTLTAMFNVSFLPFSPQIQFPILWGSDQTGMRRLSCP